MPVIHRFGTLSVRIYADDHAPPHVHIVGPDIQVLVRIADGVIIAGRARRNEISVALNWVEENRDMLMLKWAELNERG